MENDRGQTRSFLVTRIDGETLTVDGNHPLCGRDVVFTSRSCPCATRRTRKRTPADRTARRPASTRRA